MRLVGTAGHVDHGKSTLVQALTGINPDRLKEEQAREMTIDLGFAWLTLPNGETISLVDVPGHEAFIKNMLAGVGGIDVALLVIAVDEGIMPQTREHLAILDLLKIKGGVIALTKMDLPLEAGWLELIQDEIRAALKGTVLQDAEIVPVSGRLKRGLDELKHALARVVERVAAKADRGRPRLPIDRVFTMSGFGTVVTGTLSDGSFAVGDEVEIAPRGLRSRIRGLQTHKERVTRARPGGRVAINLAGVATEDLARGDVVIHPGLYQPTALIDARIEWLSSAPRPLAHNQELELFIFAAQVMTRVRLLEGDALAPGQSGWAQLVLASPVIAAKNDRFILRYPSPSITVGGGTVVEPHPTVRYRRRRAEVIERLARALQGTPAELAAQYIEQHPFAEMREAAKALGLAERAVIELVKEQIDAGELIGLEHERATFWLTRSGWDRWRARLENELAAYHAQFPLRAGMPREELKSRSNLAPRVFEALLARALNEQRVRAGDKFIALSDHRVQFDAATQTKVNALLAQFARAPYNPPSAAEAEAAIGVEALNALIEQGALERTSAQVLLAPQARAAMQAWVVQTIEKNGQVTAAELRDHFQTSRKYAIAFLEYLDQQRITRREGDARVLR